MFSPLEYGADGVLYTTKGGPSGTNTMIRIFGDYNTGDNFSHEEYQGVKGNLGIPTMYIPPFELIVSQNTINRSNHLLQTYPNPTENFVTFISEKTIINTEVYSSTGKLMNHSFSDSRLDLSLFKAGIYFVKVFMRDSMSLIKIIKK